MRFRHRWTPGGAEHSREAVTHLPNSTAMLSAAAVVASCHAHNHHKNNMHNITDLDAKPSMPHKKAAVLARSRSCVPSHRNWRLSTTFFTLLKQHHDAGDTTCQRDTHFRACGAGVAETVGPKHATRHTRTFLRGTPFATAALRSRTRSQRTALRRCRPEQQDGSTVLATKETTPAKETVSHWDR